MNRTPDGLHADRLKPNRDNPREVAFAEKWRKEHKYHDLLGMLFQVVCERTDHECVNKHGLGTIVGEYVKLPLGDPTERDRIVAATLIQWLGSNVGLGLIQEALEPLGYRLIKEVKKEGAAK